MTTPNVNTNPPTPAGYALMSQSAVTQDMTTWAVSILQDPANFPMFSTTTKAFGATTVLARVQWHPPDFQNAAVHRGVTLFAPIAGAAVPVALAQGIDVSGYQPTVDWNAAKNAGNLFAFIKATEGTTLIDHAFADHWAGASAAGVLRGAYHFLRPELDAIAQAQFFLAQLSDRGELPPVLDVEVTDKIPLAQIASSVSAWVTYVTANFGKPLIYTSPGFWNLLPAIPNIATSADLWVANWGAASPSKVNGWPSWTFWQYTDKATVSGIPGSAAMDANRFNGSAAALQAYSAAFLGPFGPPGPPSFNLQTTLGVQQALNYLGVAKPPLAEDGHMGPLTLAAVKAFQTSAGIASDGIVGKDTIAAFQSAISAHG